MGAIKVLQLDLLSIRPYLTVKNWSILAGLGVLYGVLTRNPMAILGTAQMFAVLFAGYPFLVGEESGIDPLYKLFSIDSGDVVKGRYLLAVCLVAVMSGLGMVLALAVGMLWPIPHLASGLIGSALGTGFGAMGIVFLEYPIYFRYGYKKGKMLAAIPFFLLVIIAILSSYIGEKLAVFLYILMLNLPLTLGLALAIWLLILLASLHISHREYAKKDF